MSKEKLICSICPCRYCSFLIPHFSFKLVARVCISHIPHTSHTVSHVLTGSHTVNYADVTEVKDKNKLLVVVRGGVGGQGAVIVSVRWVEKKKREKDLAVSEKVRTFAARKLIVAEQMTL